VTETALAVEGTGDELDDEGLDDDEELDEDDEFDDDDELDDDDDDDEESFLFPCLSIGRSAAFLWLLFFGSDDDSVPGMFFSLCWESIGLTLMPGDLPETELDDDELDDKLDDDEEESFLFTCASIWRSAAFIWLVFFGKDNDSVPGIFFSLS